MGATVVLVLGGCSGDPGAPAPVPPPTEAGPPAWNPCSTLDPARVARMFDTTFDVRRGTSEEPTCTFVPQAEGDAVVDVNYNTTAGNLDETLETFGLTEVPGRTRVAAPEIAGADEARLISDLDGGTLALTGFVRTGLLVQVVNVVDPAPFARVDLIDDVETLMADLAAGAEASGLTGGEDQTDPASPTSPTGPTGPTSPTDATDTGDREG